MRQLFSLRVTPAVFDERASWVAAVLLLLLCSGLGLAMQPALPWPNGILVLTSLMAGWGVLGWLGAGIWVPRRRSKED
jgi:hypothetical protein